MPDENRVFDVSKPSKVSPPPTSRPVIVGHHPMNDPMVREEGGFGTEPSMPTKIPVMSDATANDGTMTVEQAMADHQAHEETQHSDEPATQGSPAIFSDHSEEESQVSAMPEPVPPSQSVGEGPFTEAEPEQPPMAPSDLPPPAPHREPDIEGLHFAEPKPKRGRMKWLLGGLLILLIASYLVIDSGLVNAGFELPFHIFKQEDKTTLPPAASNTPQPASSGPVVPTGFKEYKLADTNLNFAAPIAWGEATSVTDPGYSKRGGTNKPDGVYAYLVNFAANKNVQVAVTSAKYLPASRTPTYYDYLQWCTGTSDGQIYESILNFSTVNKVDTPTTVTCNQGPVPIVSKLNSTTIVQTQAKDTAGKVIGDIYTLNLDDPTLVVFRVKDLSMTNAADIKQLLDTVKLTSASTSKTSNP